MPKPKPGTEAEPRYIPPGSCLWCGHKPHGVGCSDRIRVGKGETAPCPCAKV